MRIKFEYKLVVAYLLIGCLWIVFSDKILYAFIQDSIILTKIQTYKGWFYVLITGFLFFIFLKNHLMKLRSIEKELLAKNEELKSSEEQLRIKNHEIKGAVKKAQVSDNLKSEFINNLSHEIRTPLNGIIGFTGLLAKEDLKSEDKLRFIGYIQSSVNQLIKIIEDVLEVSSLVSRQINPNLSKFSVNELLSELHSTFSKINKNENIEFKLKYDLTNQESIIVSDRIFITKTLYRLLDNAFKFTSLGIIELSSLYVKQDGVKFLTIKVSDSGVGISKEKIDFVFEYFNQEEFEISKKVGGLGLGLSIAKGYLALLDGKISVESEKGKGTTFSIYLKL